MAYRLRALPQSLFGALETALLWGCRWKNGSQSPGFGASRLARIAHQGPRMMAKAEADKGKGPVPERSRIAKRRDCPAERVRQGRRTLDR